MDETNKEKTLAEAISQIETLTADKTKLDSDLATGSSRIAELESELNATQEKLTALEQKHRDIDSEVSAKVAEVAALFGVAPIADVPNSDDESIEDLAKRIDEAQGVEKAKLIEANYDRIISALSEYYTRRIKAFANPQISDGGIQAQAHILGLVLDRSSQRPARGQQRD